MPENPQLPDRAQRDLDLPNRIQRDLEDALREGGVDKLPTRPRRKRRPLRLPDPRPRNPGELVVLGVVLFVAGLLPVPFRSQLIIAGVACVVLALVTHFLQPHGQARKYWRGRYLDISSGQWRERLYRLIYRRD